MPRPVCGRSQRIASIRWNQGESGGGGHFDDRGDSALALPRRAADLPGATLAAGPDVPEARAARFLLQHGQVSTARDYVRLAVNRAQAVRRSGLGAAGFPVLPVTDWRGADAGHWGEHLTAVAGARRERKAWLADQASLRALREMMELNREAATKGLLRLGAQSLKDYPPPPGSPPSLQLSVTLAP